MRERKSQRRMAEGALRRLVSGVHTLDRQFEGVGSAADNSDWSPLIEEC